MAIASFPIFFVIIIFHALLLHSSKGTNKTQNAECPEEFPCGSLNNAKRFPFAQSSRPSCGLLMLNCDAKPHPRIQFGRDTYDLDVKERLDSPVLRLSDPKLSDLIDQNSCQSFDRNISFQNSPSITLGVYPLIQLFRCNKSHSNTKTVNDNFHGYERHDCELFTLYYKNPFINGSRGRNLTGENVTSDCSVIMLPRKLDEPNNGSGLFHMLSSEFYVSWILSENCSNCHYKFRGQCSTDRKTNQFNCSVSNGTSSNSPRRWILVAAACISGVAIFVILVIYFRRKYLLGQIWNMIRTKTNQEQKVVNFLATYGSLTPKRYSYSEVRKMTNSFTNLLGQGGYGCVYKGMLHDGSPVAVKLLKDLKGGGEEFINEVASISRTSHVNIVTLKGFCFDGGKKALVFEFMSNGSLEKFIYEDKSLTVRQLEWNVLYKIAIGIARGLEYLHRGCNTRILHFDIKPHNILLGEDFCPKISDFGLAKMCVNKESTISVLGARGTIGYIAPEVVCRSIGGVSYKSDVYSYGMMVLEMVAGRKNVDVGVSRASEVYFPHWIHSRLELEEAALELNGITNEEENECARKMIIVSLWCIQIDPASRPTMSRVVEMLEGNLSDLEIPPKPYFSTPSISEVYSST